MSGTNDTIKLLYYHCYYVPGRVDSVVVATVKLDVSEAVIL